jgi:hypothetical protein
MYKLYKDYRGIVSIIKTNTDGSSCSFLEDINNTDYQAYLKWLNEGNTPLPADE